MGPPASDRVTRVRSYSGSTLHLVHFAYGTFTPCGLPFQASSAMNAILDECPQPHGRIHGLASFPFARRYSGNRCFFLFLRVLRCFSSPGSPRMAMNSPYADRGSLCRVSPFRNLRIKGYLLLPAAYRSLSRLSSALSAKASTLRSFYFNHRTDDSCSIILIVI